MTMSSENKHYLETDETAKKRIAQAQELREQAKSGGLRFEAYLTPEIAVWVLEMVEKGIFIDPSEAVFVYMDEAKEIDEHEDLKQDILKKRIEAALENNTDKKRYSAEEIKERLQETKEKMTEPATWKKIR